MIFNLFVRLKDIFSSSAAPAPPQGTFVKGINLGGEAVTIEGYSWQSYTEALANGLATPGANAIATSVQPNPNPDRDVRKMLNSVIYKPETLEINQLLPNGAYEVYLWIMENHQTDWHSLDVILTGQKVATAIGKLARGSWARYGPYPTTVTDGLLQLSITTNTPQIDAHLMGLSIFKPL
jgi:hypothetical protein